MLDELVTNVCQHDKTLRFMPHGLQNIVSLSFYVIFCVILSVIYNYMFSLSSKIKWASEIVIQQTGHMWKNVLNIVAFHMLWGTLCLCL